MKTKSYEVNTLPVQLIADLHSLNLTKANLNHVIRFLSIIKDKSYKQHKNHTSLVDIPREEIINVFNGDYPKWLNPIKEKGIIIVNEYYATFFNQCKSYSINNKYYSLDTEYMQVSFNYFNKNSYVNTIMCTDFEDGVKNDLKALFIDTPKLLKMVDDKVASLSIVDFIVNNQITDDILKVVDRNHKGNYTYRIHKDKAINKAKAQGKAVIKVKDGYEIVDPTEFINQKKATIKQAYTDAILKLERKDFFASRNITNNRLDTNITNLCGELTDVICADNGLVQIDLKNSQFVLFSHLMANDPNIASADDFKAFAALAYSGELYTHIQEKLSLKSRQEAKGIMFEVFFSHHKNPSSTKKQLKGLFPNVIGWMDTYKKEHGYEQFSIMLQKMEAEIFIDNILKHIKEKGMFCLTKHDSLIVTRQDAEYIIKYAEDYLKSLGMQCTLTVTQATQPASLLKKKPCPFMAEFRPVVLPVIQIPACEIQAAEIVPNEAVEPIATVDDVQDPTISPDTSSPYYLTPEQEEEASRMLMITLSERFGIRA